MLNYLGHDQFILTGDFIMNDKTFYKIWSKQYQKQLNELYEEYCSEINENGATYEEYCELIYKFNPQIIETNLN